MMRKKLIYVAVVALVLGTVTLLASPESPRPVSWPVTMAGQAFDIIIGEDGYPTLQPVATSLPVMEYAGRSATGRYIAYRPLETLDSRSPNNHRVVTVEEVAANPQLRLVPSGDLYVEEVRTGAHWQVDRPDEVVRDAAWSPTGAHRLAYTYGYDIMDAASGGTYTGDGLAVADVAAGTVAVLREEGYLADSLGWSPDGQQVQVFEYTEGELENPWDFNGTILYTPLRIAVATGGEAATPAPWSSQLPVVLDAAGRFERQPIEYRVGENRIVRGNQFEFGGNQELSLLDEAGQLLATVVAGYRVVAVLPTGIVLQLLPPAGDADLLFMDLEGNVMPVGWTGRQAGCEGGGPMCIEYLLPFAFHSVSLVTGLHVTQVGEGYETRCMFNHPGEVKTHTTRRGMGFAYDMQSTAGWEFVLAAGEGLVVRARKNMDCNTWDDGLKPYDDTRCPAFDETCRERYDFPGWGNFVIMEHPDGTYTKYAHLAEQSVLPGTGASVDRGCHIGTQGHTGASIGKRNECGDHLHFQRQMMGTPNADSQSIVFADVPVNPLECVFYRSGNAGMSCLF